MSNFRYTITRALLESFLGAGLSVPLATSEDVTAGGDVTADGDVTAGGDVLAAGGFRRSITFAAPGTAAATAADQTALAMRAVHAAAAAHGFVAPRAGSITGLSASLSAAITTAGEPMVLDVTVTVNGTPVAAATVGFTTAGGTTAFLPIAKDTAGHTFAAGAVIGCVYTSTTISNTPSLIAHVELEC